MVDVDVVETAAGVITPVTDLFNAAKTGGGSVDIKAEHLIHSLKRATGLKPLRVWSESSIRGSMMLALLSETAIAMARYEVGGKTKTVEERGRRRTVTEKPNTESIVWSLGHLTLTRIIDKGRRKQAVYSNWNQISREIFSHIRADIEGNLAFPT